MLCAPAKGSIQFAKDDPRIGNSRDLREFWAMEGTSTSCQRDIERVFVVDRHSSLMLANAFELLLAQNRPADSHPSSVQTFQDSSLDLPNQEEVE